jgi:hypothetical protein
MGKVRHLAKGKQLEFTPSDRTIYDGLQTDLFRGRRQTAIGNG